MTVVVFGIDALDPEIVDSNVHSHLTLEDHKTIETICSSSGEPSTHELWPTIITGLRPEEHGLVLSDGVAWENPLLRIGSSISQYFLPDSIKTRLGSLLLNHTSEDTFRTPATFYTEKNLSTVFDGRKSKSIGIPNYVTNPDTEDREHQLRRSMAELFERDPESKGGHTSSDPNAFYEQCMEMIMIRTARTRRGLRSRQYELVFGYTSGLDLVGHVSYDQPNLQEQAYEEINDFVGELYNDLQENDELVLISDHGLQEGLHTDKAMIAATDTRLIENVSTVLDVRRTLERELDENTHLPKQKSAELTLNESGEVQKQLKDLGYM